MCFGLYIHIPFCRRKCPYCSFVSFADGKKHFHSYIDALLKEYEIKSTGTYKGSPSTLYIGGGTPSILPPQEIRRLLRGIDKTATHEITVEINPDSCPPDLLEILHDDGVTRVSLGIQSLDNGVLANLGRLHDASQAITAFHHIRDIRFDSVSIDLMFGVPGQTMDIWKRTIDSVISLDPDHISAYSLGLEEDTEYFRSTENGCLRIPTPSETAEMYFALAEFLHGAGYEWYEISNFARPGKESIHNSGYWDFSPYLGIGLSAHSFDGEFRRWNTSVLPEYIRRISFNGDASESREQHTGRLGTIERIMLQMRTRNGIVIDRLGLTREQAKNLETAVNDIESAGFLEEGRGKSIAVTMKGAVIIDEIITEMIAAIDGI